MKNKNLVIKNNQPRKTTTITQLPTMIALILTISFFALLALPSFVYLLSKQIIKNQELKQKIQDLEDQICKASEKQSKSLIMENFSLLDLVRKQEKEKYEKMLQEIKSKISDDEEIYRLKNKIKSLELSLQDADRRLKKKYQN